MSFTSFGAHLWRQYRRMVQLEIKSIGISEETDVGGKEFLSDVKYGETKSRYQVRLPWKEGCLPESSGYPQCAKRLEHVYSNLKTEPVLLQEYDNVIRQQLRTGIIEEVSEPTKFEGTYYLPHHGVVRREKLTTKVRVVFGAERTNSATMDVVFDGSKINWEYHKRFDELTGGEILSLNLQTY